MPVFSLAPISGILQFPPPASPPPSPLAFLLPDSLQCFVQSVRSSFRAWVLPASSVSAGPLWSTQPCKGDSVTGRLALKPPGIWRFFPVPRDSHPDSLFISSKERNSGWILPPVPFPVLASRPLLLFFPFLFFLADGLGDLGFLFLAPPQGLCMFRVLFLIYFSLSPFVSLCCWVFSSFVT